MAELEKVLKIAKPETKSVLLFLSHTGLRISELYQLRPDNVNDRMIYVYSKGHQRCVPLNKTALKHLPNSIKFLESHRNQRSLYNLCQRLAKKVGCKPFSPHSLRHLYCTRLSKSIPLCVLSKLLGHANTTITERVYVHLHDSDLLGATDCLD
jgi:integrase